MPLDSTHDVPPPREAAEKLLAYCREQDWAGYDPYDGLNSRLFSALPFLNFRWPRLAMTQIMKRSPINLRPLLLVPKTHNPKGLALFIMALLKLGKTVSDEYTQDLERLTTLLLEKRSPGESHYCWGYSFAWQQRFILVPLGTPNIICTSFAANALLDLYEYSGEARLLDAAASSAAFILERLSQEVSENQTCFSYVPGQASRVHNANLLGAALLARVAGITGETRLRESALTAARYSVGKQQSDGSWMYGEQPTQRWIDSFHTGYNLCALHDLGRFLNTDEFHAPLAAGYRFYLDNLFGKDGSPNYYHDRIYPLDIHTAAQALIALSRLREFDVRSLDIREGVYAWTMSNMRGAQGCFHYQRWPRFKNRISYIRWSQAWMLLGLSAVLVETRDRRPDAFQEGTGADRVTTKNREGIHTTSVPG